MGRIARAAAAASDPAAAAPPPPTSTTPISQRKKERAREFLRPKLVRVAFHLSRTSPACGHHHHQSGPAGERERKRTAAQQRQNKSGGCGPPATEPRYSTRYNAWFLLAWLLRAPLAWRPNRRRWPLSPPRVAVLSSQSTLPPAGKMVRGARGRVRREREHSRRRVVGGRANDDDDDD